MRRQSNLSGNVSVLKDTGGPGSVGQEKGKSSCGAAGLWAHVGWSAHFTWC